ncbi:MAG: adenylyltransferase/cytidyltransferase family protein [Proteobacteria bacterium]|jgi:rfaE bifunctional protein nucleotidyltransferase chain/domain|nr:adenylyltransferase/cytidyltransferase family protein [Pseudomonadota bacterium]
MADKIFKDVTLLQQQVENLKKQHKKIVFTNGGFNILHVGHIRSLQDAKQLGDVLVVAVNSDDSLRRLKGVNYPLIPEDERLEVLAALECVDVLTLFSEPTVDSLLLKLKPHIHAKGTDYTKESVPERETVLSYGGEIAIVGDAKDHASSSIISRIRESLS